MRKVLLTAALAVMATGWPLLAHANIGTLDAVPAATLLIPYFEVDLGQSDGADTIISVQNTSSQEQLANIVIWSDLGIPVSNFTAQLISEDLFVMSLRDIISPAPGAQVDPTLTSCPNALPPLGRSQTAVTDLQLALTGQARTQDGLCAGINHQDDIARGYVTIDTIGACANSDPTQSGYFVTGGAGVATNQNVLVGDYFWSNPNGNFIHGEPAVHLEADGSNPLTSDGNVYTFYGRFVGWSAADNREPMVQAWGVPYTNDETEAIVWQDPRVAEATPFACDDVPTWMQHQPIMFAAFDDQEHITQLSSSTLLGLATSRIHLGGTEGLALPYQYGWLSLGMNGPPVESLPLVDTSVTQGYVVALQHPSSSGTHWPFTVGGSATPFGSATSTQNNNQGYGYDIIYYGGATPNIGTPDLSPAATALLPYFEVDLDDDNGANTVISLFGSTAVATLIDATLWTDMGVRTYSFQLYLTGYDMATIDLRLLFKSGIAPLTASAGQDPQDVISPHGNNSQDINFASCNATLPTGAWPAVTVAHLRNAHTGQASALWNGQCGSVPLGDNIARGYITFDIVDACNAPAADTAARYANYWATTQDYLGGSYTITNRDITLAYAANLVMIDAATSTPIDANHYTFYGAYTSPQWNAADQREALPSAWRVHFVKDQSPSPYGAVGDGNSSLIVWRDAATAVAPFTCGTAPAIFPLTYNNITAFDEEEHSTTLPSTPFLRVANRIPLQSSSLNIPYAAGFLVMDLTANGEAAQAPIVPNMRQSFVGIVQESDTAHLATMQPGFPVAFPQ